MDQRCNLVWPIFERYERLKRQEWRYDLLDLVGHVFRQVAGDSGGAPGEAYAGTPLHVLYRDEVRRRRRVEAMTSGLAHSMQVLLHVSLPVALVLIEIRV